MFKRLILVLALLCLQGAARGGAAFKHPGILHTTEDLQRMRSMVAEGKEPWKPGFELLKAHPDSQSDYPLRGPFETAGRGPAFNDHIDAIMHDCNAAYQNALMWAITGDEAHAAKAVDILNAWSYTHKKQTGRDVQLGAGLWGFKFASAAEILRYTYPKWQLKDIKQCEIMLREVFYPPIKDFATFANGNWDGACIKTIMAIGVFCDDREMFDRGVNYFYHGEGNGRLTHYVINESGQCQESGRDQAHTQLGLGLLCEACEIGQNQGLDLYGAEDNRLLKGFEYTAKYNLGEDVPFVEYTDTTGQYHHTIISTDGRGKFRPVWEMAWNHYHNRRGLPMPYTQRVLEKIRPEGAAWTADHPGFGTVLFTRANSASTQPSAASHIDEVLFGDAASEQSHEFSDHHAERFKGALVEPARRLLPLSPRFDGGWIAFSMKVDPQEQNYVTAKFWGSDKGQGSGRLLLYANGLQVGYRHEGDYDVLNQCDDEGEAPGRFLYQTLPLPLSLTQGKTSVNLKIAALGPMWPYGANFAQYQKNLTEPSRGIYRVYTHLQLRFVPDPVEMEGEAPQATTRPGPGKEVIAESKQIVIDRLNHLLQTAISSERAGNQKDRAARLLLLAEAYNTAWTPAYHDARAIEQIVQDGDSLATEFAENPRAVSADWHGAGPLGEAIMRAEPAISKRLDETIVITSKQLPRRQVWTSALRKSVDYWRTHRRSYTNQSMIVDWNIYAANRALQLIDPKLALPESRALRYLHEAVGIEPWLGSDPSDDRDGVADTPEHGAAKPFGDQYYLVTRKGLSRELGWVGTYGETILHFTCNMATLTGDERIRQQLAKLERARRYFRYPGVDADGFRCMKLVSEVDNRTAHYPLSGGAYTAPNIREEWWMDVPALLSDDPVAVGAAQQSIADNQYFAYVNGRLKDPDTLGMMRNVDEYAKVKASPATNYQFPMADGQPDFAFADEEDAIVAIKHGDTRLFVNLYYRAERAVNSAARVYEMTPTITRIATVRTEARIDSSGHTYTRPDWIDAIRSKGMPPPGQDIHQAWAGEVLPVSARPSGAALPAYGDWGPFLGKAESYRLQWGDFLIVMNCSEEKELTLDVPPEFSNARDLISGKSAGVALKPLSTIVLCKAQAR